MFQVKLVKNLHINHFNFKALLKMKIVITQE